MSKKHLKRNQKENKKKKSLQQQFSEATKHNSEIQNAYKELWRWNGKEIG